MRAPIKLATIKSCRPMGPQPATNTVSPSAMRAFCTALRIVLMGSRKVASSNETLSGSRMIPRSATRAPASVGSKTRCEAGCLVLLALRKQAAFAVKAFFAWNMMKTHHAVAGFEFCDTRTGSDDGPGEFVTENLRRLNVTLKDFLDVGAANAAGGNFDEHFVGTDFGDRNFFYLDHTFVAVDSRAHGRWNETDRSGVLSRGFCSAHRVAISCSSGGGQPCSRKESSLINPSRK